jgi:hypothetical protein
MSASKAECGRRNLAEEHSLPIKTPRENLKMTIEASQQDGRGRE